MNEKFIMLSEKYLSNEISDDEKNEFKSILESDEDLKREFEEQRKIKEVMRKMTLKNPAKEFWDEYWTRFMNRFERGVAWIAIVLGSIIVLGYLIYYAIEELLANTDIPNFLKFGIAMLSLGLIVLIFSVIREKLTVRKHDKYKEIQR